MSCRASRALGVLVVCASASVSAEPTGSAWRVEAQTVHHLSVGGETARLLNGGGLAIAWQFTPCWQLVGSVNVEGSMTAEATYVALPIGFAIRRSLLEGERTRLFARAGLALAREWVSQYSAAGPFADEDFGTTRLDVGLGAEWRIGRFVVGAELRVLSQSRWEDFGDAPDHPQGLGLVPRSAAGMELGALVALPL
jgi:hypothetical protein